MAPRKAHPSGATMRAVCMDKFGKENLRVASDVPRPVAEKDGQVLIRLHAAALNPIDKIRIEGGLKLIRPEPIWPALVGYDGAGVVEESKSAKFKAGDEVYVRLTNPTQGSLAEYCVEKDSLVALKPKQMNFVEAASLPLAAVTAMQAFQRMGVKEGDKVFISGGAGGVGTLAIQLAKHVLKCKVVATSASPGEKTELCKSLGADVVVNYKEEKFEDVLKDYDYAFDTTNESHKCCKIVKRGGKVVTIAGTPTAAEMERASGKPAPFVVRVFLWFKRNSAAMSEAAKNNVDWSYLFLSPNAKDLESLASYVDAGQVKAVIDSTNKLEDFRKAYDRLASGRSQGKCVITLV